MNRARWAIAGLLVLTGCASVTEHNLYTLDMRASDRVEGTYSLESVRIRSANALTRPQIMIRTKPTEITYYATHDWASDLGEMVAEKLKAELGDGEDDARIFSLDGTILAFEQIDTEGGANAHIKLELDVYRDPTAIDGDELRVRRVYEVIEPADAATPAAVVRALSKALETIAVRIAADLERLL